MRKYAVILAADLASSQDVLDVTKKVGHVVDGIKIGVTTILEAGKSILSKTRDLIGDKPLLMDLKIADIGFLSKTGAWQGTNSKIIKALAGAGATHVTVHGFPGPGSIAEAISAGRDSNIQVLLLPLMSHAGASLFFSSPVAGVDIQNEAAEAGIESTLHTKAKDVTEAIISLGEDLGAAGYIGPATRPTDLMRYRMLTSKPIWCPGFGRQDRQGRNMEEQFRAWAEIVGPESAAIVGSAIFQAADPEAAAREICEYRDRVAQSEGSGVGAL